MNPLVAILVFLVVLLAGRLFLIVPTIRNIKTIGKNGFISTLLYILFKLSLIICSWYFIHKVLPLYENAFLVALLAVVFWGIFLDRFYDMHKFWYKSNYRYKNYFSGCSIKINRQELTEDILLNLFKANCIRCKEILEFHEDTNEQEFYTTLNTFIIQVVENVMIDMEYHYGMSAEDCEKFSEFIYSELGKNQFLDVDSIAYVFTNLCLSTLGAKAQSMNIIQLLRWVREYIFTNANSKYKVAIQ